MEEDLSESNRYLLAAIFKNRPRCQDEDEGLDEKDVADISPQKRKKAKKQVS